jgi:hypothetical protein
MSHLHSNLTICSATLSAFAGIERVGAAVETPPVATHSRRHRLLALD